MRPAIVAIGLLSLLGCASVRKPRPAEPSVLPPGAWSAAADTEYGVADRWWRDLEDPVLDRYVEEALSSNPALAEAEARLRAAFAIAGIAGADRLPSVSVSEQAARANSYLGEPLFPGIPSTRRTDSFGVSLNVSWELDLWARIRSGEAAALADAGAREAMLRGVRLSLAAQTAKAYLAAAEAEEQREVALANQTSAEDLAERIRQRYEQGLRRAVDVKLAASEVASARASVAAYGRARDAALRQLESLVGRYPSGGAEIADRLPALPPPVRPGIPAEVLSRRPDLAAAELALAASSHRIQEAEASLYPRISLTGSGGLASSALEDLVRGDFGVWSFAENLVGPLFEGGRLRRNVDLRKAQEDEAAAAFASRALTAFREVETALAAERYLAEQAAALDDLVREAREGLLLSEDRYLAGLVDILTVLEARRRHFLARGQLLRVRFDRLTTRIDLYAALGGGTDAGEESRSTP